jgi:hypothetical protein
MDKLLAHFILSKILLVLCLIIAAPVWYPAARLASALEAGPQQNILAWGIRLLLLVMLFGLYWLAKRMSYHMTIEGKAFRRGVKEGLLDARLHLAFLPLIGHWFAAEEDKRNWQEDDNEG